MRLLVLLVSLLTMTSCGVSVINSNVQFSSDPLVMPVSPGQIDEASGMADSRSIANSLWVLEDSGNPAELTVLGHDGQIKGRVNVTGATNRDWEEMANGPGPQDGVNYLYVGDIGDNNAQYGLYQIYRFPEPRSLEAAVTGVERINFTYPDGARDAEAMFVDPQTKDIYIISKREARVHLYRLNYPQNINEVTTAEALGELPIGGGLANYVTSAAISPDGSELLVRTYTQLFYWKRSTGQSIPDALQRGTSRQLVVRVEPQGESVCFDKDAKGFYTISERANSASVNLYYYAKK